MRPYEVMVIFDTGAEPPAIQAVVDRLLDTIRANDGAPGHVDRWGRRPFAYEVKHRREGYYVLVELAGAPKTVAEVDRLLSLADEVLRFKVIRLPEKVAMRARSGGASPARSPGRSTRAPAGRNGAPARTAERAPSGDERAPLGDDEASSTPAASTPPETVADGTDPAEG